MIEDREVLLQSFQRLGRLLCCNLLELADGNYNTIGMS